MAIDLTGIQNENEFYSDHYLTTVFEGDIKGTIGRWNQENENSGPTPHEELARLATPFIRVATEYKVTRDPAERTAIFRRFAYDLLLALGYDRRIELRVDADGTSIPVLSRVVRSDGSEAIWIVEALAPAGEDFITDPLALEISAALGLQDGTVHPPLRQGPYEDVITAGLFGLDRPPRFVLLLSMSQAVLIDRNKWGESRLLRFDLTEIFTRREAGTLQAVAALLHRESLAPDGGTCLIDTIDEESHRHAHGVSKDLKYALREAIELLGNEAADQIVTQRLASGRTAFQTRDGKAALDARELSLECLRYMYRLLFLFYIEARPDLGFAPMKSEAYRKGYSLECLRALELVPLASDEEKAGHFINDSLNLLFRLVYEGTSNLAVKLTKDEGFGDFEMRPVRTHLFDPDTTKILSKVRFPNETLQRIVQLMSLSRAGQGHRGRISYAQLGINQLGAVYEALLSYSGFFAQEDMYEVKKDGEQDPDPLEAAYFVPRSEIDKYNRGEIVYDGNEPRVYPKGAFIYRLAGRDRENSASYYTPEILTRCIVKYTLKELLKAKKADEILGLTICEPAMGSAAFLVEAVNQLTEAYLSRKQEELGERIPHEKYAYERQKVRAYITDRNVFGVDLNPIAMELGQVSLWLNCIHEGDFIPWFGDQLFAGNSLIGARRDVYPITQLRERTSIEDRWYKRGPRAVNKNAPRGKDEIYHFLLPDPAMADYKKAVVEPLAPSAFAALKEWHRQFSAPLDNDEIEQVRRLSVVVDQLLEDNANALAKERRENIDPISIWGQSPEQGHSTDYKEKNRRLAQMRGEGARSAEPYQRLKTAMDYWCALWFWPLTHAATAPSREQFFLDMTLILEGNFVAAGVDMFQRASLLEGVDPNELNFFTERKVYGQVDIATLKAKSPRLRIVEEVANKARFFHWAVELGDVLLANDGFDLILGNPPWIRIHWSEVDEVSDHNPMIALRTHNQSALQKIIQDTIKDRALQNEFLNNYTQFISSQDFLGSVQNYPNNKGQKVNLYKCFIELAWRTLSDSGRAGFLHPDGIYDSPDGDVLREALYLRLQFHARFSNELKLFPDIGNRNQFSINVYRGKRATQIGFDNICNLFHPNTLDECYRHDGSGEVPGIKTADNHWQLAGHRDRIVVIDQGKLSILSNFFDAENASDTAGRLPIVHSEQIVDVLRKLSSGDRLAADSNAWGTTREWNEGAIMTPSSGRSTRLES
jgi:N-6 DNA Methylase